MYDVVVNNLTKVFGGEVTAADSVSFQVEEQQTATLLGYSGSGKSTVLRCIAGLETPEKGEIRIKDQLVFSAEKSVNLPCEKRNLGMVFQNYAVWPHLTVFENVAFGMKIRKYASSEIKKRVKNILELVNLGGYENRYPSQLSGGQQQRVALARSIVYDPQLLLLDEPLANLDARLREKMRHELREIQKEIKTTMVYVTHDQSEALVLSDVMAVMDQGKIVQFAPPEEILHYPATPTVAAFIGNNNVLSAVEEMKVSGDRWCATIRELGQVVCGEVNGNGEKVFVYFDASQVELVDSTLAEDTNHWRGEVTRVARIGYQYDLSLDINGVEVRVLTVYDRGEIRIGDQLSIRVDPEKVKAQRWGGET